MHLVVARGLVDGRRAPGQEIIGVAARCDLPPDRGEQLVAQTDVAECAAHHDLVVATAGTIRVEVLRLDAAVGQVPAGGAVGLERAGRRDVVGGHRIAEQRQHTGAVDVAHRLGVRAHAVEEGLPAHVGGGLVPGEQVALGHVEAAPALVAVEHGGVVLQEHLTADRAVHHGLDLGVGGPDVLEEHGPALRVRSQRLGGEVEVHRAGERVGDDQRRRGQVVHLDVRRDAPLEVAVARQHGRDGQVVGVDGLGDLGQQRPGVADAGGAAVADELVAQGVQVVLQPRGLEVVGDDLGARCQRGLDPRFGLEALGHRVAGDQSGGDHHRGVRGVRAAGDRGDGHGAVGQFEVAAEIGVNRYGLVSGVGGLIRGQRRLERLLGRGQFDAVLRALRPGDGGDDRSEVEFEVLGVGRLHIAGCGGVSPQLVRLGIRLDQGDLLLGTAGQAQVVKRDVVDREDAAGRAEFRPHIADGGAVGQRHGGDALAVEFHELADDAVPAQHVGDGQDHVGGRDALRDGAGELEADDARHQHGDRLAEHGGLRLDAADAPAEHAQTVDRGGVRVGADAGIEIGEFAAVGVRRGLAHDDLRQVFDVDLVDDAGARRHHAEVPEGLLPPAQELVAFAVAPVFDVHVAFDGISHAVVVDLHRMVDDHVGLHLRVDDLRVAAQGLDRVAHRGQVDHAGHAGEVLHDHAAGRELDLMAGLGIRIPVEQRPDMVVGDVRAVDIADQVLGQHLQRVRQMVDAVQIVDAVVVVFLARHVQRGQLAVAQCHESLRPSGRDADLMRNASPSIHRIPRYRVRVPALACRLVM